MNQMMSGESNTTDDLSSTTISAYAFHIWASTTTTTTESTTIMDEFIESDGEINRFSRPLLTFAAVMTIIIMIVGIFGNLLTIIALIKCPKVRNVAAAFIISLCIADCIFCTIVLPFNAFRFIQGTWTHGDFLCQLVPFLQYGNIGVSLLCIAMITINRYIMIAHHSSYGKVYKRHWIGAMIAFCWIFSYGMQLPTLFKIWGIFAYDPKLRTCSILEDEYGRSSKTALFIIAFLIPCIIIIACYARIFWVVHESEVRLRKHASKQNSIPNNLRQMPGTSNRASSQISVSSSINDSSVVDATNRFSNTSQKSMRVKDQRDVKAKRNEWRITKMVLAIFLSFVMCYLPITVIKVADKDVEMPGFHVFGYIMLYLSSCINPIIYVIMNKQYRQAYKTVLMCKPSRLLPFTNTGSNAAEMERHRIQLQPQSYHGIADFYSGAQQQQQQQSASFCGTHHQKYQSSELENRIRYQQKYPQFEQGYQHQSSFEQYKQPTAISPIGITATIYPTARFSTTSKYSHHIGGRRCNSGRGRTRGPTDNTRHSKLSERHSR